MVQVIFYSRSHIRDTDDEPGLVLPHTYWELRTKVTMVQLENRPTGPAGSNGVVGATGPTDLLASLDPLSNSPLDQQVQLELLLHQDPLLW